jgi:hypothetical protein
VSGRFRLDNRREHHVIDFNFRGTAYRAGFCFFANGALAEIFLSCGKPNSQAEIDASDSAILCSLCLQHGVALQVIRHALLKADDGTAAGGLARAIDLIDAASYR